MFPVLLPTPRVRGAAERDPLVARLRAFGFRVSTATFFSNLRISRFHRVESHRPTRNLLVKRPENLWATVINPRANECRSTNSSRRTSSICVTPTGHLHVPTVPPMSWLAARAAREACSTSGRHSLLRGAIASCIARGADADAVAPHPSSRWETAFPSALWRQDRGAKRANRRVDVVLLQVRPRPRSRPIDDDDDGVA